MTSEHLPRTSVPLSLTILPGTVLPDLPFPSEAGPRTRWGVACTGVLISLIWLRSVRKSNLPSVTPKLPDSCHKALKIIAREQRANICEQEKREGHEA